MAVWQQVVVKLFLAAAAVFAMLSLGGLMIFASCARSRGVVGSPPLRAARANWLDCTRFSGSCRMGLGSHLPRHGGRVARLLDRRRGCRSGDCLAARDDGSGSDGTGTRRIAQRHARFYGRSI